MITVSYRIFLECPQRYFSHALAGCDVIIVYPDGTELKLVVNKVGKNYD